MNYNRTDNNFVSSINFIIKRIFGRVSMSETFMFSLLAASIELNLNLIRLMYHKASRVYFLQGTQDY